MKAWWIAIPVLAGLGIWGVSSCESEPSSGAVARTAEPSPNGATRERGEKRGGKLPGDSGDPTSRRGTDDGPREPERAHSASTTVTTDAGGEAGEPAGDPPLEIGRVIDGQGVDGQSGSIPTVAELLFRAHAEDTRLVVRTEPPEALAGVPEDGWLVRAGDRATLLRLAPQLDAAVDVWLERVDTSGASLGPARHLRLEPRAIEAVDGPGRVGPELESRGPGLARGSRPIRGVPGLELATLRWHRQPFARLDEVETTIELVVDDPHGVLEPLPARVVIPAGERSVVQAEPLRLTGRTGTARLHFRWDGKEDSLEIRSQAPVWSVLQSPPRVPVNAVIAIESKIDPPWAEERIARCVPADDGRLQPSGPDERSLDRLRDVVLFELRAQATGTTRVRMETPRLEPLTFDVEVTAPTVEVTQGELRLHPRLLRGGGALTLNPIRGGVLRLSSAAEPPTGVTIDSVGKGLRIAIGDSAPDTVVELAVEYEPPLRGLRFVRVDEQPRERAPTRYFIEVQE